MIKPPPVTNVTAEYTWPRSMPGRVLRRGSWSLRHDVAKECSVVRPTLAGRAYRQLANLTGLPAIDVPLHRIESRLPLDVQFVGRLGNENAILRLATPLEEARPERAATGRSANLAGRILL